MKRLLFLLVTLVLTGLQATAQVKTGDERTDLYLPLLNGKRVALFSNHTGLAGKQHVLDLLLQNKVNVTAIFSPEHGFRGKADAGEHVSSSVDPVTGVPILSMYDGNKKGPSDESMSKFDVLVVDIQDVGLRYYTYYITMIQLMGSCADKDKEVVLLDRPNPNGHYVDGPILDMSLKSGVGGLPIPIVHGMTLGELAQMANGEGWINEKKNCCKLTVIPCANYTHQTFYNLPVAPSPNLPNMTAIYLYASTCYFEGTDVSLGRGTDKPFQQYGHPDMGGYAYCFTPTSRDGAKTPPQMDNRCWGVDLSGLTTQELRAKRIDLSYVIDAYHRIHNGKPFFTNFFNLLTGKREIQQMIEKGMTAQEISATWKADVEKFKKQRKPYLLYAE
ncbi:MAG: DUF1343 domain-containing protein [Bacteroidaceae bacterium]|nr:DUF1343 domain-containing protein [Bacteroidaceae bacterium]